MSKTTINGIDCYGVAELGANYDVIFENGDWICATDVEETTWTGVVKHLTAFRADIVEIEAV